MDAQPSLPLLRYLLLQPIFYIMNQLLLAGLLSFCFFQLSAQCVDICGENFIANGDFEVPLEPGCSDPTLFGEMFLGQSPVENWLGAVQRTGFNNIYTPDYLSPDCQGRNISPCDGTGSLGLFTVTFAGDPVSEYIQSQLNRSLEAGKEYCIQFSLASAVELGSPGDGFDVFLLGNRFSQDAQGLNIPFTPAYSNPSGSFIPEECTVYSFNYVANGGEQWIVFGNKDADQTQTEVSSTQSYVVLDNVSLFEVVPVTAQIVLPADTICENAFPFDIQTNPLVDGFFLGAGVDSSGRFEPDAVDADSTVIRFIYGFEDCLDTATQTLYLQSIGAISILSDETFCLLDTVIGLQATPEGGVWTGPVDASGSFNPDLLGPGSYTSIYTVDDGICIQEDTFTFVVQNVPELSFSNWQSTFRLRDPIFDIDVSPSGLSGQFFGPGIVNSEEGLFSPAGAGVGRHRITYRYNTAGCSAQVDSVLEVGSDYFIPNAFSPNGDGINDVFRIEALPPGDWVLQIYNRWGSLLYESRSPETEGWDGSFQSKNMDPGVFVWSLSGTDAEGFPFFQKGTVTLLR